MENIISIKTNCEKINNDEEEKPSYFKVSTRAIVQERANNQDLLKEFGFLILKYAKLKDIAEIRSVIEYMYYSCIEQRDFIKWCRDLYNEEYTIEEQVDKFMRMYRENYLNGFKPYIL